MEITEKSKLLDVLEAYPDLEGQIVSIAPPFRNLKNPILRRTVGSLATLESVAHIGGMDAVRLVNTLRRHVGLAELSSSVSTPAPISIAVSANDPQWIGGQPRFILNGTELLNRGEVPLVKVNELLPQLSAGETLLLVTNFEPSPIMEAMRKQKRLIHTKRNPERDGEYLTFIA